MAKGRVHIYFLGSWERTAAHVVAAWTDVGQPSRGMALHDKHPLRVFYGESKS